MSNTLVTNGALPLEFEAMALYSTAAGNLYFNWEDAQQDNARQLATKFTERFGAIATAGLGRDWAYVGWFTEMLDFVENDVFPLAYADYTLEPGSLATLNGRHLPYPPPGEAQPEVH